MWLSTFVRPTIRKERSVLQLPAPEITEKVVVLDTHQHQAEAAMENSQHVPGTQTQIVPYREEMLLCLSKSDDDQEDEEKARVLERVEVVVAYKKGKRVLKIICIPEGEPDPIPDCDLASINSADDSVTSMVSELQNPSLDRRTPTTFLEEFARTVLDPCQCQTFLKPALRKEPRGSITDTRSVSFDTVDIKEFPMTLGDHPSATSGPPVALDWERIARERRVALDEYEASRLPRRNRKQLKLSLRDRKGILQTQFSAAEVNKAWEEAKKVREQRRETIQRGMMMMFLDDVVESANRNMGKMGDSLSNMIMC